MDTWQRDLKDRLGRPAWPLIAVDAFHRRFSPDGSDVTQYLDSLSSLLVSSVQDGATSSAWAATAIAAVTFELLEGDKSATAGRVAEVLASTDADATALRAVALELAKYGIEQMTGIHAAGHGQPQRASSAAPKKPRSSSESATRSDRVASIEFTHDQVLSASTCLIVCALHEEAAAFDGYFGSSLDQGTFRRETDVGALRVLQRVIGRMGNVASAIAAVETIASERPEIIILAGIAGGIEGFTTPIRRGDLIIPPSIVGYELGKETPAATERRLVVIRSSTPMLDLASRVDPSEWVAGIAVGRPDGLPPTETGVHFVDLLSGEKVVSRRLSVERLHQLWPGAAAVEMEAFGLALAAFQADTQPQVLVVKGVSDWADETKADDEWRDYARFSSAAFCWKLVEAVSQTLGPPRARPIRKRVADAPAAKNAFVKRLGPSWIFVANELGVETPDQRLIRRENPGYEGQGLWEYLVDRDQLDELPAALLSSEVNRPDLAAVLWNLSS